MTLTRDQLFELIAAAYLRGIEWGQDNPDALDYAQKAASDYADKTTSPLQE